MTAISREFDPDTVTVEELEEHYRDVLLERATIVKLTDFRGWKLFEEFIEGNADTLAKATHGAVFQNFGDVFSDQFAKGQAVGLRRAPRLMTDILGLYDKALEELQALIVEKNNGSGTSRDTSDADSDSGVGDEPWLIPGGDVLAP